MPLFRTGIYIHDPEVSLVVIVFEVTCERVCEGNKSLIVFTVDGRAIACASDHGLGHGLKVGSRRIWPGRNICVLDRAPSIPVARAVRIS